jgi:hypothetical protein
MIVTNDTRWLSGYGDGLRVRRITRGDITEEAGQGLGEHVVVVAGHHVPGSGDIDKPRTRNHLQDLRRALRRKDVRQLTANKQRGDVNAPAAA